MRPVGRVNDAFRRSKTTDSFFIEDVGAGSFPLTRLIIFKEATAGVPLARATIILTGGRKREEEGNKRNGRRKGFLAG